MEPTPNNRVRIRKTKPSFNKDQKAGFALIIGISSLAIILGVFYVGNHLASPLIIDYSGPLVKTDSQIREEEIAKQRVSDADEDTLTDFDELYVFKTSPYLADTDGDGIDDGVEVANQTDPTCPQGSDCTNLASFGDADSGIADALIDNVERSAATANEVQSLLTGLTGPDIRTLLLQSGATEADLADLTDEELYIIYNQTLAEMQESGEYDQLLLGTTETTASGTVTVSEEELAALQNMTPTEIRGLLLEYGADAAVIDQLSDEEVTKVFFDSLSSVSAGAVVE
ncbi:MAG: hypothetical protein ABH846_00730 [Patescibacteria group bacterium]